MPCTSAARSAHWSEVIANAAVFLLVRDDLPLTERQQRVRARAGLLPAFARQCSATFARAKGDEVAPELCKIAVGQLRATATFYREGFARAIGDNPEARDEGEGPGDLNSPITPRSFRKARPVRPGLQEYATTFRLAPDNDWPTLNERTRILAAKRTE
jgi:hypothetical protein